MKKLLHTFVLTAASLVFVLPFVEAKNSVLGEINKAYYSFSRENYAGFASEFSHESISDMAGKYKDSPVAAAKDLGADLDEFRLKVRVSGKDGFRMYTSPYPSIKDEYILNGVRTAVASAEKSIRAVMDTWMQFALNPVLPEKDSAGRPINYEFTENAGSWRIEQSEQGVRTVMIVRKSDFQISRISMFAGNGSIVILPEFIKTDKGLLFQGYRSTVNDGAANLDVRIRHRTVGGVFVPDQIEFKVQYHGQPVAKEVYKFDSVKVFK